MPPVLPRLLLALALAAVPLRGAPPDVGLAVLRHDGRLQPLAVLTGDEWTPLDAAAAAGPWAVWPFDDPAAKTSPFAARASRAVTAAGAAGRCLGVSGLDPGTLPAPAPAPTDPPAAHVAVALRGSDARPDIPVRVALESALGLQLAGTAAAAFHRAEDETLTLEAEELPAGFPRFAVRRERPITWTLMARQGVAQGAVRTFYLEGRKDYPGLRGRSDVGEIRTTGSVFVRMDGDRATIDAEVDLSDLDGRQSMFRSPLAVVGWPSRSVWIFAARGPDGAQLEIVELMAGRTKPRSVWQGPDGCDSRTPAR